MADFKELIANVASNPAKMEWLRDQWGISSEFKRAGLLMASKIKGDKVKHDLAIQQITLLVAHIKKRFDADVAHQQQRLADIQAATQRPERQGYYGSVQSATEVVEVTNAVD